MAKINYWQIPDEWVPLVEKLLAWNDRFFFPSVRSKRAFTSRKRVTGLTQRSLMPQASQSWQSLSAGEKDNWAAAAGVSNQTGFQLFLQDYVARVKNNLSVPGTPSTVVQHKVGRAVIAFPAAGFLLRQEHPFRYYIQRKVTGSRDSFEPVEIIEDFALPFTIGISHRTDLQSVGANSRARFYVEILSNYQGRDIVTEHSIQFGLTDPWRYDELVIASVQGLPKCYTAYIDVLDCDGTIEWDNVKLYHSGQNWARDFRCNNVRTTLTRAFYYIARNWEPVIEPPGFFYDSIHYEVG